MFPLAEQSYEDLVLKPLSLEHAVVLGEALSRMPPWSHFGWTAAELSEGLKNPAPGIISFEILVSGRLAGLISLQWPWLLGPYLQRLAILPGDQGNGIGQKVLSWMESCARLAGARQMWLCVSSFNPKARAFYERFGFTEAARLDRLVTDEADEILMRKRLI
jgi:ribosomal protein S18 acetylase RimI-like enzyme